MPINKKAIDEKRGTRFYWNCSPGDEYSEWIEVRLLSSSEIRDIDRKTKRYYEEAVYPKKKNGQIDKRAQPSIVEKWDWKTKESEQEHDRSRNALCLRAWCIYEETDNGELIEFPYSTDNVNYLIEKSPEFSQFAFECIASLARTDDVVKAESEKNLGNSRKQLQERKNAETA